MAAHPRHAPISPDIYIGYLVYGHASQADSNKFLMHSLLDFGPGVALLLLIFTAHHIDCHDALFIRDDSVA